MPEWLAPEHARQLGDDMQRLHDRAGLGGEPL